MMFLLCVFPGIRNAQNQPKGTVLCVYSREIPGLVCKFVYTKTLCMYQAYSGTLAPGGWQTYLGCCIYSSAQKQIKNNKAFFGIS